MSSDSQEDLTKATEDIKIVENAPTVPEAASSQLAAEPVNQPDGPELKPEKKKKKAVGFAPPPEEDLKDHHKKLKEKELEEIKSNPFHKIPPELAYLERKNKPSGPKPLPAFSDLNKFKTGNSKTDVTPKKSKIYGTANVGDLRALTIKEISVANKQTEVFNFNYPTIGRPIALNTMIVDVQYAGLNSFDLGKINKYAINVSEVKIGIGYEFAGYISDLGLQFIEYDSVYKIGQPVVGILSPYGRKGALATSLLLNPKKDFVIPVSEETLEKLKDLDVQINAESKDFSVVEENGEEVANEPAELVNKLEESKEDEIEAARAAEPIELFNESEQKKEESKPEEQEEETDMTPITKPVVLRKVSSIEIDPELTPLAKLTSYPVLYSRAKAALEDSHANFLKNKSANVLINGADTNLGLTLFQLLNSSVYSSLESLNIILVTRESSRAKMEEFVKKFTRYDPSRIVHVSIVPFDLVNNEDLVLEGEKTPILYKKPNLFACEILDALFVEPGINKSNVNKYKLDSIIDIVGGSKYLQTLSIKYSKLETLTFPFLEKLDSSTKLRDVLNTTKTEPFLIKILKPKSHGSNYISCCKYGRSNPSYQVDQLIQEGNSSDYVNPWSSKWTSGIANSWLSTFNYFSHIELESKQRWLDEGLQLLLDGEIKFKIDDYGDWRTDYKKIIGGLKKEDKKAIFKIETF